ncbi:MAG: hypothetical protein M0P58_11395 [Bacteroidales bacterium]|nr:hypothetical protein [Bacteroidales bacterium]
MRINSKETMYGQPVLKIREICRQAIREKLWGENQREIIKKVVPILNKSYQMTKKVLEQMIADEYLQITKETFGEEVVIRLQDTAMGRRFGMATADKPITRIKAEKLLSELIERAKMINGDVEQPYIVGRLVVFGSYLSETKLLSDLDIGFKLIQRESGDGFMALNDKQIEINKALGKSFRSYIDQLFYPRKAVVLILKGKVKNLSLHDMDDDAVFTKTESKVVFENKE